MATAYSIDSIQQSFDVNTAGTRIDVMRVTFVTDAGDTGSVTVPLNSGWQQTAADAIAAQVAAYDQLRGSGGV